ncbi:membrane protein of ER body 2-like isoform X2 [Phragmites australis]|uniref:membrane protein of ER body 2-like isoform X2 n=1 Tax=Phragmites australis TaxID=29695 RepID=UPI002D7A20FA|nr:membrane protein of ER body 2-like isoform X2 [Phragmites australis]
MMEVEKPWESKEEVGITEEEQEDNAAAGGLQTRKRKKKPMADLDLGLAGHASNGDEEALLKAAEEEEEHTSVFVDPTKGLWKCRHCDWTYRLSTPCRDDILSHQGYCQIARNLELLVQNEPFYNSSDKVSDNVTEVSAEKEVTEAAQLGGENKNVNETSSAEGKELEKQENVSAQETNHKSSNGKLENGSRSNGVHEASSNRETVTIADGEAGLKPIATIGDSASSLANWSGALDISNGCMNRTEVHEIEVEKDEHATKGKVSIEEYDLEKILDEQETHDLYCPNCNSCITRRVILRKRKRTVRQAIHDEPPKKPQLAEPSANASNQSAAERHDQESPDVFRCLSCFTFFIPTGCGFNIFRIFERREVNQQVQVQHSSASREMSDNCGSWLLSCFQTVDSPKKPVDADPAKQPLLSGSQNTNDKISSVEDNTSSAHSHATIGETEQSKKPLQAGSSSIVQTTTTKNEEIKQSFGEFHGATSSSVTVHTSSSTTSQISSWQSETGFMRTEERHMVTVQQDGAHQEQIPLSKPDGNAVTDSIHLDLKEENTTAASENNSFFSQEFLDSEVKVPTVIPTKVSSEVDNLTGAKPTSVIPQPVQPEVPPHLTLSVPDADVPVTPVPVSAQRDKWDILKAIVYGGLVESITSLSVVSAAAASGAKTLDIFILGIANLIGGLPIIFHNIADLRNLGDVNENNEQVGQYWLQLGRRSKYRLHMFIAILSYIMFGLLPPVIYGLSFRESDNRDNKMMVVAAASLACVALLAIGKAHVKRPRTYITTLLYYLSIGLSGSGLSYVAGVLITRLLAHFGLIDQGGSAPTAAPAPPSLLFPDAMGAGATAWASN